MDLVAKKLGATQEIVDIDFAQITSGAVFAAKKCGRRRCGDHDQRQAQTQAILFSDPYFDATQALLVKKDSGITDLSGLKGKKIGVQTDTTGADYTEKNKDANGYEVVVFDDLPTQSPACSPPGRRRHQRQRCRLRLRQGQPHHRGDQGIQHR